MRRERDEVAMHLSVRLCVRTRRLDNGKHRCVYFHSKYHDFMTNVKSHNTLGADMIGCVVLRVRVYDITTFRIMNKHNLIL